MRRPNTNLLDTWEDVWLPVFVTVSTNTEVDLPLVCVGLESLSHTYIIPKTPIKLSQSVLMRRKSYSYRE